MAPAETATTMTRARFQHTLDWEDYWTDADEDDRESSSPSAQLICEPLLEFLEKTNPPTSFADVGCGTGVLAEAVAERYPSATVVGYDAARAVVEENRERVRREGPESVAYEQATLPAFEPGRQFDVVTCFYTLCYVADVEAALQALYHAVAPGGHLVFTYHNRMGSAHFRRMAEEPEQYFDEDSTFDAERFPERFQLLIEGENLLSYERIAEILGTRPRSVWSVAEDAEKYGAWRHNPLVYVPK